MIVFLSQNLSADGGVHAGKVHKKTIILFCGSITTSPHLLVWHVLLIHHEEEGRRGEEERQYFVEGQSQSKRRESELSFIRCLRILKQNERNGRSRTVKVNLQVEGEETRGEDIQARGWGVRKRKKREKRSKQYRETTRFSYLIGITKLHDPWGNQDMLQTDS